MSGITFKKQGLVDSKLKEPPELGEKVAYCGQLGKENGLGNMLEQVGNGQKVR